MTMFSAGAVPKRKPTFSAQIGQVKATPEPEPPKQGLTKAQHRERAVQEIFDSEKTYLVVLQRIIWVNFSFFVFLNFNINSVIITRYTKNHFQKHKKIL